MMRDWGRLWGVSDLERIAKVRMSARLTRSLGRCNPNSGLISLRAGIPSARLPKILCHEAAHLAAFRRFGPSIKPHGPEWAGLMRLAGLAPTIREYTNCLQSAPRTVAPRAYYRYAHRCTVCQSVRWAQRRMSRWRCLDCIESGLEGEMTITDLRTH
jgi:hypothetical protein